MKNETGIITAANSKTMNAVESARLFAAAADSEFTINFNEEEKIMSNIIPSRNKANLKKIVKKK